MRWRTARQEPKAYAFAYDNLNRLTASHFYNTNWTAQYTEQFSYDPNGYITAPQRYRPLPEPIDNLVYTYHGNRLATVTDSGTPDGYPQGITNYTYDANGNNTFEGTRTRVTYNEINLPQQVQLLGGRGIKNIYAADGRKLKTETRQGTEYIKEGTKTYSGNLVFDINDELDYIIFDEGRILYNIDDSTFNFEYHLRDHLGSTRVAFVPTASGIEVVQENSFYPFGAPINDLSWSPKSTNRYLREGKEYISDFDWNKYDFTGRTFDSWALRALQVDPMATKYYSTSPYALWINNPLRVIDPTGEKIVFLIRNNTGKVINQLTYNNGNFWYQNNTKYIPNKSNTTLERLLAVYRKIENLGDKILYNQLQTLKVSDKIHYIEEGTKGEGSGVMSYESTKTLSETQKMVNNNLSVGTQTMLDFSQEWKTYFKEQNGIEATDMTTVTHEMQHQYDYDQGKMSDSNGKGAKNPAEIRAVKNENRIREIEKLPKRTKYGKEEMEDY
jgi:RHS repeat-associated protein